MLSSKKEIRDRKIIAFADNGYYPHTGKKQEGKLSRSMAMFLGLFVTIEIMIGGAMILNIDFHTADMSAVVFAFAVLYFGVVAGLTDK